MTKQNLFCMSKKEHAVKAKYFKKVSNSMPKLLRFGYLSVKQHFSLIIMVQDGIFQFLDPFTLTPYASFTLPISFTHALFTPSNTL